MRRYAPALLLVFALFAAWMLAAEGPAAGLRAAVPSPQAVLRQMIEDGAALYRPAIEATSGEAAVGYLWGNLLAFLLASIATLAPASRRLIVQLGTVSASVPVIVVGPLLAMVSDASGTAAALAALAVFFGSLMTMLAGFEAPDRTALDLFRAYGARRWQLYARLQLPACRPALFAALAIAAPASLLGAILGEWLGSASSGLGVALVIAMQQLNTARSWGIALVCGTISVLCYRTVIGLGRGLTPGALQR